MQKSHHTITQISINIIFTPLVGTILTCLKQVVIAFMESYAIIRIYFIQRTVTFYFHTEVDLIFQIQLVWTVRT